MMPNVYATMKIVDAFNKTFNKTVIGFLISVDL